MPYLPSAPRLRRVLLAAALISAVTVPATTAAASAATATAAPASAATASAATVSGPAAPSKGDVVKHDITFVAMMVPHHETGIDMARLARKKASTTTVRKLAARIEVVQSRQVAQMKAWLKRHHTGPMQPPRAVRDKNKQDLDMLRMHTGHEFDMMFLMMMRSHHEQAVSAAEDEIVNGRSHVARQLARDIKVGQLRELALMNKLLAGLHRQHVGMRAGAAA